MTNKGNRPEARRRRQRVLDLAHLCSNIVGEIVEHRLGEIPMIALEDELETFIEDWVEEVMDEQSLADHIDHITDRDGYLERDDDEFD